MQDKAPNKYNYTILNVTKASYAFYTAGMANGRLEGIKACIDQLVRAVEHYKSEIDRLSGNVGHELDPMGVVNSVANMADQLKKLIPQIEKESKSLLDTAIKLDRSTNTKSFSTRIVNAIDGLIAGWNK